MFAKGRKTMEKDLSGKSSFRNRSWRGLSAVVVGLLFALVVSGTAFGQNIEVTGTVTSTAGAPLQGVTVRVQVTDTRATTDATGKYRISAPGDEVLNFSVL